MAVTLLLGIHNHQPIGNFEEVFEEAYRKAYLPFALALKKHPRVLWNLHCTGILWEYLERKHPEYLDLIRGMVERGQMEILTGGFYEPILAILPDEDKAGQIKKLSSYIKKRFGTEPEGLWCAERVWEPHLPKALSASGVKYTLLDDSLFFSSGLSQKELTGHFRVEEAAWAVDVFPITEELRFYIPFQPVERTLEFLRSISKQGPAFAVMADDGEKFGLWPETHKSVYEEGWLERFLEALEKNESWIRTALFSGHRKSHAPAGRVYLPSASYFEMSEWALPTERRKEFLALKENLKAAERNTQAKGFITGGTWRNFLAKYPESNSMYKKMLRVSKKVHSAAAPGRTALDRLWAGQCNCAYWHGTFGGLYFPVLRHAIYKNLIEAERALDKSQSRPASVEATDFDGDGKDEVLFESPAQNIYLSPQQGGSIFEWDFKAAGLNVANVLSRRPEPYHEKLQKSPRASSVSFDAYRRSALIDHFFPPGSSAEQFTTSGFPEEGDFVSGAYEYDVGKGPQVSLSRKGRVQRDKEKIALEVRKTLKPAPASRNGIAELEVSYVVRNASGGAADLWFGTEFNLAFSVSDPRQDRSFSEAESWEREDPYLHWKLSVRFDRASSGWVLPLKTVSSSIDGIEETFQGLTLLPHWKFSLAPGESFRTKLILRLAQF